MAVIDAVMADKRAADVIEKYRKRLDDWANGDIANDDTEFRAITTEMQSDIANAINAAIAEVLGRQPPEPEPVKGPTPAEVKADAKARQDAEEAAAEDSRARTRNTTHMPATGSHAKR